MSIDRILVAVDDSSGSRAAMAWAVEMACAAGAVVTAVHAFEPLAHLDDLHRERSLTAIRNEVHVTLEREWCSALREADVPFDVRVIDGDPADVILDLARELDVDLIVLGARRQGLVRALALGSTSQRVIHEAKRPVTILHPPDE